MANLIKRNDGNQPLQTWDPFQEMRDTMREMFRWDPFQALAPLAGSQRAMWQPGFDVRETPDAYVVEADLPGVSENDVEITMTGNRLQISGKRDVAEECKQSTFYCSERFHGSFVRAFTLPDGVDADQASSSFRDGVLTVRLPKRPEAQPRRIAIGSGAKTPS
jgi:HSP20 family protein